MNRKFRMNYRMFLWSMIAIAVAGRLGIAVVFMTENPAGNVVVSILRDGISKEVMALAFTLAAFLALVTPLIIRRWFGIGFILYILSSMPTLFYILRSYAFFRSTPGTGSSVVLILFAQLYIISLLIVAFTSMQVILQELYPNRKLTQPPEPPKDGA